LFTLVEHFIELQEMTHPGSAEKAKRIELVVSSSPVNSDAKQNLLAAKSAVRNIYSHLLGLS
jgi:hypothetical protein